MFSFYYLANNNCPFLDLVYLEKNAKKYITDALVQYLNTYGLAKQYLKENLRFSLGFRGWEKVCS